MRTPTQFLGRIAWLALLLVGPGLQAQQTGRIEAPAGGLLVEDIFGRNINKHGLILVDWEGYIANPAIKFYLTPPPGAAFPARAVLTAAEPRLRFDLPTETGAGGPRKEVVWQKREKIPVHISIFPDRDASDEHHRLRIDFADASGKQEVLTLPVHVIDQDRERA